MDELTVAGKIMDSAMNENMHDEASETGVTIFEETMRTNFGIG